jgi:hypothetical protein
VRDYRLVSYLGVFQVCSKARRLVYDEERLIWIYGKERLMFCYVGQEDAVYPLPESEPENFFGDRFTFAVDEIHMTGEHEKIAGANNIYAARAAFDEYLHHQNKRSILRLRHGGRIIAEEKTICDSREWILKRRMVKD